MPDQVPAKGMGGWGSGLLGIVVFSGSLPATRVAVLGFSPWFLTSARAAIAGLLGSTLLIFLKQAKPTRGDMVSLWIVVLGVVIGFPILTALALQHITSVRSIVFVGFLPLTTAVFGVIRGGERPHPMFWVFSALGGLAIALFALSKGGSATLWGDLLMVAAIIVCGLGYAEGAVLSRRLGGWQVISWALLLALPFMSLAAIITAPPSWANIPSTAWIGLVYVSVFSMLIGFIFWYRGLALGGIAKIGQLQLLQPFLGLMLAGLLLHEPVAWTMIATTGFVVLCVAAARKFA